MEDHEPNNLATILSILAVLISIGGNLYVMHVNHENQQILNKIEHYEK